MALAAALALAAAGAAGVPRDAAGAEALRLSVALVEASPRLGEDLVLRLTVENPTRDPVTVPELRLAADSVSVRVSGEGVTPATVTRLFGEFVEDAGVLRFQPAASRTRLVPPGGRVSEVVRIAAVAPGKLELRALLARPGQPDLEAPPLPVEVVAPGGAKRLLARVETTRDAFTIEVDGAAAFASAAQFWALARSGHYDDLPFHRSVPGVFLQTGDGAGDGTGTSGWYLPAEHPTETLARGAVAFARGPHADSGSSQWFVALTDTASAGGRLAGAYTVVGRVVEGIDVADALAAPADGGGGADGGATRRERVLRVRTSVK